MRIRVTGILVRDGKVLMVECYDPVNGPHLNFPGGGLDPGETLIEGVTREVKEECCVDVRPGRLLTVTEHWDGEEMETLCFAFEVEETTEKNPSMPSVPDLYQTGVGWYSWEELDTHKVLPPILRAVKAAIEGRPSSYAGAMKLLK